jgi:hypothetical protein
MVGIKGSGRDFSSRRVASLALAEVFGVPGSFAVSTIRNASPARLAQAYLRDGLWPRNAAQANDMAQALAAALAPLPGVEIQQQPEANILICRLPMPLVRSLQDMGFRFYHDRRGPGSPAS